VRAFSFLYIFNVFPFNVFPLKEKGKGRKEGKAGRRSGGRVEPLSFSFRDLF
jgi:hypothetical protein